MTWPNNRDYAIIVGVEHYRELKPLKGPINDATALSEWLSDPSGGGVPAANIYFIPSVGSNPLKPIKDDIDDALCRIVESVQEGLTLRRLYFFFAGHGIGVKWDVNGLCLPKWSSLRLNAALSSKSYLDCIVESNLFEEVYFFLDCCRNRKLRANPLHPDIGWPAPGGTNCKSIVFFATSFESYALEGSPDGGDTVRGYFSEALINGLKGGAVDNSGVITCGKLIDYVKLNTAKLASKANQSQMVDIHVNFRDVNHTDFPLFGQRAVTLTRLKLTFLEAGEVVIEDAFLQPLKEGKVNAAETWMLPGLAKGLYLVRDLQNKKEKQLRIDGTLAEIEYEF